MSHEHEAVYLAVASLDFELSPDERRRMEAGLAECPECAEIAASHGDLARAARPAAGPRRLAAGASTDHAGCPRAAARSEPLAGPARGGGAARPDDRGGRGRRAPSASARRSTAAVVQPSASLPALGDVASPSPSTSASAGIDRGPVGIPGSAAAIRTGHPRRGRVGPTADPIGAARRRRLDQARAIARCRRPPAGPRRTRGGERLRVVPGHARGARGNLYASWPVGWVARGDHDGSPWIAESRTPCPSRDDHDGSVVSPAPPGAGRLLRRPTTPPPGLRVRVAPSSARAPPRRTIACVDGPAWLTGDGGWSAKADTAVETPSIGGPRLAIDPDGPVLAVRPTRASGMVDLEGAFDHPAADAQCRPGAAGPDAATDAGIAAARLRCRARFVVTERSVRSPTIRRRGGGHHRHGRPAGPRRRLG